MTTQLAEIDWHDGSGAIVHIGAGYGEELGALRALPVARIVLVEPNPDCLAELSAAARADDRIAVIGAAVSAAPDMPARAPLHVFNIEAQSSLRAPGPALRALFPALRETGAPQVDVLTPDALLDRAALPATGPALLVLDAPGESVAILAALLAADRLDRFGHVLLRAPRVPMHDGALPLDDALDLLQGAGYRTVSHDDGDPDFPEYLLCVDVAARLDTALRAARADADATATRLAQSQAALGAARTEAAAHADRAARAETALTEARTALDTARAEAQKRETQLTSDLSQTRKALGAAEKEAASRRLGLDAAEQRARAAEDKVKQRDAALTDLEAAHAAALDTAKAGAKAAQEAAEARTSALIEDLETRLVAADTLAEERRVALAAAEKLQADQAESLADLRSVLDTVTADAAAQLADLQARLDAAEAQSAERETARAALEQALEQARADNEAASADAAAQLADLQARLDAAEAQSAERETARAALEAALEQARADSAAAAAQLADLQPRLDAAEEGLKDRQDRIQTLQEGISRRDGWLQDFRKRLETASAQADQRETARAALEETLDKTTQTLTESQAALETLRAGTTAQIADLQARLKTAEADMARRDEAARELGQRLEQKEMDVGVALRSQAAAQSDLLDLRGRFERLRADKDTVDGLLMQVTSRLNAASDYLHMLGSPDAGGRTDALPPRAAAPEPREPGSRKPAGPGKAAGKGRKKAGGGA